MSFLLRTSRLPLARAVLSARPLSTSFRLLAVQGYGDDSGDPVASNPQAQGSSNSTKHSAEHPGPAPPSEGKGSGGGPTKGEGSAGKTAGKSPEDASAQSGGSRSKEAKETGGSPTAGKIQKGRSQSSSKKVEPKILDFEDYEKAGGEEARRHNEEFKKGHDHGDRNV